MNGFQSETSGVVGARATASPFARRAFAVVAFAIVTAIGAKIAVPLPGTPVPFTLQPLFVLLAGALLGSRLGAASQVLYLAAGVVGLPVFAAGGGAAYLLGPTGGYLMAYPLAAFLAGAYGGRRVAPMMGALLAGLGAIYLGGLAWLSVLGTASWAVAAGLTPFVLADLVKVLIALLVTRQVAGPVRRWL